MVINSHCHYHHIESNYLFRGKPLYVHEKDVEYCNRLYLPEFTDAFFGIMDVKKARGEMKISDNVRIIETTGHTQGSITTLVDTDEGLLAVVGDVVIIKEDLLGLQVPSVVTTNVQEADAIVSLRKIRDLNAVTVIPGRDAPFCPQDLKQPTL